MRARQYSRRAQREMRSGNKENAGFRRPVCVAARPPRRIESCGKTPGERAITRFAAQTRSRPPVTSNDRELLERSATGVALCLVPQSWSPQARDRQATGTGLFDGDRFDMIATGVLLDHLKLLYQPLNRYTSLLTETEIFVDTRKAAS